jgi:predicted phage baseplate assembly protein
MNVLDLVLDDRSFDDLVEIARSRLPTEAPAWTDYNLHDPGITLIELMAWLTEAQIYSLGRLRRDEREAYARFAGIGTAGPRAAVGLIWPDTNDPTDASTSQVRPFVIGAGDTVRPIDSDRPRARVLHSTLIVPGRIVAMTSLLADIDCGGRFDRVDRTRSNARGQVAYLPFGPDAGPRDALQIDCECASPKGLSDRADADSGALLSIGVRVDSVPSSGDADAANNDAVPPTKIEASLLVGSSTFELPIKDDGSRGFSRSGAIALRLPAKLPDSPAFSIVLRAPRGFACPPRVLQIALNVISIEQSTVIDRELHVARGEVDETIELNESTLRIDGGAAPLEVEVASSARATSGEPWRPVRDLLDAGPTDAVYQVDAAHSQLRFGNGINGRLMQPGAQVYVSYSVCDGATGNQPRSRRWFASGIGPIGRNLDPVRGGADAATMIQTRTDARRAVLNRHALVTAEDIAGAALALTDLQVARAKVLPFAEGPDAPGTVTLIALRRRAVSSVAVEEPQRWLDTLRLALQPRLPLGQRLVVRAPDHVDFQLHATLRAAPSRDIEAIQAAAIAEFARRLNPIADKLGQPERSLGAALNKADIGAWLRRVDGVSAVIAITLRDDSNKIVDSIDVGRHGLPRLVASNVSIDVMRSSQRSRT